MKQTNIFLDDILDLDKPEAENDRVWVARKPNSASVVADRVEIDVPFELHKRSGSLLHPLGQRVSHRLSVRGYGGAIIRATLELGEPVPDGENAMLEMHDSLEPEALHVESREHGWCLVDANDRSRMHISTQVAPTKP